MNPEKIDAIKTALKEAEDSRNIKVLYAVESGSRAWGFESEDSDWDVRFVYIHPADWYLQIDEKKDSMEVMLPGDIDLAGWELRKALRLFRKSNPPMLEWLNSPIVYADEYGFAGMLRELIPGVYNPRSCMYHYISMARGNYKDYLQSDMVKLKKYFYAIRPILACDWIRTIGTMPPTAFRELKNGLQPDAAVDTEIEKLLLRKVAVKEMGTEPANQILIQFIAEKIDFYSSYIGTVPDHREFSTEQLNKLFRRMLNEVWA